MLEPTRGQQPRKVSQYSFYYSQSGKKKQGQRHLGLDFTWDKDNGNLTWIDNWLWSTINLDQQLTWISNQLGSIIKLDQQSTLHLDQQLTYIYNWLKLTINNWLGSTWIDNTIAAHLQYYYSTFTALLLNTKFELILEEENSDIQNWCCIFQG